MAIIKNIGIYSEYPFEAIRPDALNQIQEAYKVLTPALRNIARRVVKAFECYLQVTGQKISAAALEEAPAIDKIYRGFVGALNSSRFIETSDRHRYVLSTAFVQLLASLNRCNSSSYVPSISISFNTHSQDVITCIRKFEALDLNEEKAEVWRGWPTTNRNGKTHWLPLLHIYQRLGREFTEQLYNACDTYYRTRRAVRVPCIKALDKFIETREEPLTASDFKRPSFITKFWRTFFEYYLKFGHAAGQGASVDTLVTAWRNEFISFANEYLIKPGIFAKSYSPLPSPVARNVPGAKTNIKRTADGVEVKTKLLTPVPLQLTDSEAMQLLFQTIRTDVDLIVTWAEYEVNDMWSRYEKRCQDALMGNVRHIQPLGTYTSGHKWLTNTENPVHLQNAAATFAHYGYCTSRERDVARLYPTPLSATAHYLALPTRLSLLPHCALLVANHPEITEGFLQDLELFNKTRDRTGFVEDDAGARLVGYKDRKGAKLAQQVITLNPRTTEVVRQLIALTQPLREFLKSRSDGNWRMLFLSCQRGFGYPKRVNSFSPPVNEAAPMDRLSSSLARATHVTDSDAISLMNRFSLTSLRASVGVLVYLETHSVEKMAKALGHTKYDARLLAHYLPEPLLSYFQERWIRIFQAGIIVEAMKGSPFLLEASEFSNMDELDIFLANHALKDIPGLKDRTSDAAHQGESAKEDSEIVYGVSIGILTALLSLHHAVIASRRAVCEKALYWSEMTRLLVVHIESERCNRPDLFEYLTIAKQKASPENMAKLIYG